MKLIITCEHGGNLIPIQFKKNFNKNKVLDTHRGYDLGALDIFKHIKPLANASYHSKTSRLLVELNRSLHHQNLFSEFTKNLTKLQKTNIINTYYLPYRTAVENAISSYITKDELVLHLSIHSFTPNFNGKIRNCDIGLLYDSSKQAEKQVCKKLKIGLLEQNPNLKIRYNYPYLGKADGFTTYLRKQFPENYLGIEIEINQQFSLNNFMDRDIKAIIYKTIAELN